MLSKALLFEHILLYADDILLIAPSLSSLQQLLLTCVRELEWLDMPINSHKSCCLRIGPRFKASCANICSINGRAIGWSSGIKYLGIFIVSAKVFRCSFCKAKQSFYRSFNAVFGKIGRIAIYGRRYYAAAENERSAGRFIFLTLRQSSLTTLYLFTYLITLISMLDDRLPDIAVLSVHSQRANALDLDLLVDKFANKYPNCRIMLC